MSISVVALTVFPESDLYEEIRQGRFTETSELEKLQEQKILIQNLTAETTIYANTVSNTVPLSGKLPHDKKRIINLLQNSIDTVNEKSLRLYREGIIHL